MNILNLNFLRTTLTWLAISVTFGISVLGCDTDAVTSAVSCANSWIGPKYAGIATTLFLIANQLLKANQGGGFGAGLVAPTVVVASTGAPGTVTQKQVDSTTAGDPKK